MTHASQTRWFTSIIIATLILGFGCRRQVPTNGPPPNSTSSQVQQSEGTGANEPIKPQRSGGFDHISGISVNQEDSALETETKRIDPTFDGWSSESFNEHALAQLKRIAAWLEGTLSTTPSGVFDEIVNVSPLRPQELKQVWDDSHFNIKRWDPQVKPQTTETSPDELMAALRVLLPVASHVHAEFKIITVETDEAAASTLVRCHFTAASSDLRVQQNAAWNCRWTAATSKSPKLASIELVQFEEIQSNTNALFGDRTHAVFQHEPCFSSQLAYSIDYWRDRLDWRFGWQGIGSHGVAVADVNGDGLDDIYICETGGLPNRLLVQQSDGTVRDISQEANVAILEPTRSALLVDLDNDGDQDLIAAVARFVLVFENDGNAKFKQHPTLQGAAMIRSLSAADYNNDGLLDVYACGYNLKSGDAIGLGQPMPYHDANNGAPNYLMANEGNFRFKNVTDTAGLNSNNSRFSYAAAWEDFDNDGDLDLYVANDYGRNNLYENDDGQFRDIAADAGVEDIAAGMSVSWGDYNRDGLPDLYVGNMFSSAGNRIAYQRKFKSDADEETKAMYQRHARGNSLFENVGDGTFRDVSQSARVTEGRWAWGSNFVDINNDGWQDLVVGNGMMTGTDDAKDL